MFLYITSTVLTLDGLVESIWLLDAALQLFVLLRFHDNVVHRPYDDLRATHAKWQFEYLVVTTLIVSTNMIPARAAELTVKRLVIVSRNYDTATFS
jgi:hypothetical protein